MEKKKDFSNNMALTQNSKILASDVSGAIKSITRSGTTFTYTTLGGSTGTFTQQDNNTTYSAGTGISISGTSISNVGVTSVNGQTGAVTISTGGGTATAVSGVATSGNKYNCTVSGSYVTLPAGGTWAYILSPQSQDSGTYAKSGTVAGGGRVQIKYTDSDDYAYWYCMLAVKIA